MGKACDENRWICQMNEVPYAMCLTKKNISILYDQDNSSSYFSTKTFMYGKSLSAFGSYASCRIWKCNYFKHRYMPHAMLNVRDWRISYGLGIYLNSDFRVHYRLCQRKFTWAAKASLRNKWTCQRYCVHTKYHWLSRTHTFVMEHTQTHPQTWMEIIIHRLNEVRRNRWINKI